MYSGMVCDFLGGVACGGLCLMPDVGIFVEWGDIGGVAPGALWFRFEE